MAVREQVRLYSRYLKYILEPQRLVPGWAGGGGGCTVGPPGSLTSTSCYKKSESFVGQSWSGDYGSRTVRRYIH